ncbi:hypothetical protein SCUCBS95973_009938 [Sporothrix curviconia]|uniref:Dynamin family protein n=1 Tax=Sporothrix curviconia TaxID=1260050 RepID=A0ABP0D025_9PEZI
MAPINIQSQDYRDLLDIIDSLRSQGLDQYVPLPEIIVCGDQSSGKSSVLEAISGLSFPSKDSLCTRFATELVLRRHSAVSIAVSIEPHRGRTDAEKASLKAFHASLDPVNPDIGPVIEEAKLAMGLVDGDAVSGRRFSNDKLRIEMSGPTQQHLTLVDLPGLFHAGSKGQSADEAPVVRKLVLDYITRPRSIILAVVSGGYEFVNQIATQLAREVDPRGMRTMGLITKPDKAEDEPGRLEGLVKLAANRDIVLQLGWHVLRNRDHATRHATREERDANEASFFAKPGNPWLALSSDHLGIDTLRPRLSTVLMDQILAQLAPILKDIEDQLQECEEGLARLGTPRATVLEQRQYLSRVSSRFTELLTAAVQGNYTDKSFFGTVAIGLDGDDKGGGGINAYQLRLRSIVQNRLTLFAKEIHNRGKTWVVVGDSVHDVDLEENQIRRTDYIDEVKGFITKSRGCELPGTFNPLVVTDLFRNQCRNWGALANECVESIVQSSFAVITAALKHIVVEETSDKIMTSAINPIVAEFRSEMLKQVRTLLTVYNEGHPITYNHYLTENVQKARNERQNKHIRSILKNYVGYKITEEYVTAITNSLASKTEADMLRVAASDAIDYADAYYKVALKTFIDNVSVLVVEQCLVSKLPSLFTPNTIYTISDKDIGRLAGEKPYSVAERQRLAEKKTCLQKCEVELRRLDKHHIPDVDDQMDKAAFEAESDDDTGKEAEAGTSESGTN